MYFYDDIFSFAKPTKQVRGGTAKPRTAGREGVEKKGPTLPPPDLRLGNDRPFYSRPSRRNRRAQPFQQWLMVACALMTAVVGYLLGRQHWSYASKQNFQHVVSSAAMTSSTERPPLSDHLTTSKTRPETDLILFPGGTYSMGDSTGELKDARPHQVNLSPFMMARHEVSLELWDRVMLWGRDHGYPDLPAGSGKAHNHPVYGISWVEAVKWCNAFSEKEGLTPCYYTEPTRQNVARKGTVDITNQHVRWEANGYRLPTEAEWEFAARGGLADKRFPWGDEITHDQANYHGCSLITYDKSQCEGTATALMSSKPYTAAIGSFQPNRFGLHDMAGNVSEWCWDFYDPDYGNPLPLLKNPHGPDKGQSCVVRGGSWRNTAAEARCASRFSLPGDLPAAFVGLRVVRSF